jgi:UDP-GlcNAc3NAcA epimerase
MNILTVLGARPQFIKAAIVSRAITRHGGIRETILHTGQHFDVEMSDVFFEELELPKPTYHLGVSGLGHAAMTGRMLERIDEVIAQGRPDAVLVYGDTNSTLAAALAAAKRHVPVAHVEAGVRSFNRRMPEEINRVITDRIARWLFCASATGVKNLATEGIQDSARTRVADVGDVMYDLSLAFRHQARLTADIAATIKILDSPYYLATVHREENLVATDGSTPVWDILRALETIGSTTPVVMPLHPRTRQALAGAPLQHVRVLEPVGYLEMMALLSGCAGVFTDSGGLQKEAYYFGKPCVTLREETEWVELVEHGANVLAGADSSRIVEAERALRAGAIRADATRLYGDGHAADRIVEALRATA